MRRGERRLAGAQRLARRHCFVGCNARASRPLSHELNRLFIPPLGSFEETCRKSVSLLTNRSTTGSDR
jgi:hypothetical protein